MRNLPTKAEPMSPHKADSPLVSVVIPTYNRADWLCEAVESVLAQTYAPIEIIVVDDGSTDGTPDMLAARFPAVRCIVQPNAGVSAARNRGLAAAAGQYINFLDDDDLFMPDKIARQVARLEADPELFLVHCRYHDVDAAGHKLGRVGVLPEGEALPDLLRGNFIWMSAPLIRREAVERVGGFDETLSTCADYDLWLRLAADGARFGCVQEPLGCYRLHGASMVTDAARVEREVFRAIDRATEPGPARAESYAGWYLWLGGQYAVAGRPEDARRCLLAAGDGTPPPSETIARILLQALSSHRVPDPAGRTREAAAALADLLGPVQVTRLMGLIDTTLAWRAYFTDAEAGRARLSTALAQHPYLSACDMMEQMVRTVIAQLDDPAAEAARIYDRLPTGADALRRLRRPTLGAVWVAAAFESYHNARHRDAVGQFINALAYDLGWARNRGVVAALARSLPRLIGR